MLRHCEEPPLGSKREFSPTDWRASSLACILCPRGGWSGCLEGWRSECFKLRGGCQRLPLGHFCNSISVCFCSASKAKHRVPFSPCEDLWWGMWNQMLSMSAKQTVMQARIVLYVVRKEQAYIIIIFWIHWIFQFIPSIMISKMLSSYTRVTSCLWLIAISCPFPCPDQGIKPWTLPIVSLYPSRCRFLCETWDQCESETVYDCTKCTPCITGAWKYFSE